MTIEGADRGLLLGDGLFETLLWRDRALVNCAAHAARLDAGCAALGLPAPDHAVLHAAALKAVATGRLQDTRAAVRLTWTAGAGGRGLERPAELCPRLIASAAPSPRPADPARLATVDIRRNEGSPASRHKTLAYLDNVLARREAVAKGAEEALMLNNRGEIAGGAAANLFWFEGDALVTPALDCGVLDGITRRAVIVHAQRGGLEVREVAAGADVLKAARGLFLTNSLIGLRPVAELDGAAIALHPTLALLAAAGE